MEYVLECERYLVEGCGAIGQQVGYIAPAIAEWVRLARTLSVSMCRRRYGVRHRRPPEQLLAISRSAVRGIVISIPAHDYCIVRGRSYAIRLLRAPERQSKTVLRPMSEGRG